MNFIMWLAVGVIVGRLASLFIGTREGIVLDIIVGIVGAFVAGLARVSLTLTVFHSVRQTVVRAAQPNNRQQSGWQTYRGAQAGI